MRWLAASGSALVLALLGGCLQAPATAVERAASFQALTARRVGDEALQDFVARRTALLIGGMPAGAVCSLPGDSVGSFVKAVHGRYALGSATAIDGRGYFLTAAHCVDWPSLHVLYFDADGVRLSAARLVWRGDSSRNDLAVLAIDRPLTAYFAWADGIEIGNAVVGVGPEYEPENFGLGYFSGVALKLEPWAGPAVPAGMTLYHTGPMHLGDSGGPLANPDGQLIGINVGDIHELDILRFSYQKASRAHRPDLDWLRDLMESDFASNPPPSRPAD
jgi:S1-C subfamily serine protease